MYSALYPLTQSENHHTDLTSAMIAAISDLFLRFPEWRKRLGDFCVALDRLDLSELRQMSRKSEGVDGRAEKQRTVIAAYLQLLLAPLMEPEEEREMVG